MKRGQIIGLSFLLILGAYIYYQSATFREGPIIAIESPSNGATVTDSLVRIEGYAKNISRISMNGDQIFTDENHRFSEELLVSPGYTIITINALDRFNRSVEQKLELIYNNAKEEN